MCVLVLMLALVAIAPAIASPAASPRVEQSGGRITILADEATLSAVAEELSRKAGVTVYLDRTEEWRKVSADVRQLSFEKGIRALVHPLNYAIVTDRDGRITELRIFKNTGTKENAYKVFAAPRSAEATFASAEPSRQATPVPASPVKVAAQTPSAARSSSNASQPAEGLAGPSTRVTGERAFQYSVWMNQRMKETEQIQQSLRVRADQVEAQERQMAAVTTMTQMTTGVQQENTAPPSTLQGAMSTQQGQTQTQSFMQSSAQQRGFNNYMYYQQRAMRDNYSFYNMRRGQ